MMSRLARMAVLCQAVLFLPRLAFAAPPASLETVTTRSGVTYRGTIIENVPGDHVSVLLPNGETRVIPASDLARPELPSDAAPAPAVAPPTHQVITLGIGDTTPKTTHGPPALVRFESEQPGLTLYRRMDDNFGSGSVALTTNGSPALSAASLGRYTPVCTAPCAMEIPTGTVALGVGKGNKPAVPADEVLSLTGPATVRASLEDRSTFRMTTGWIFLGGLAAGAGLLVAGGSMDRPSEDDGLTAKEGLLIGGGVAVVAGLVAGLLGLTAGQDEAHVQVVSSTSVAKR